MKRFTLAQTVAIVGVGIVAAVVVSALLARLHVAGFDAMFKSYSDDDEAPIIVRNGSLHIETTDGHWEPNGDANWSNETRSSSDNLGYFWVRVNLKNGTHCADSGKTVQLDYSDASFNPVFTTGGGRGGQTRTQVAPRGQLDREDPQRLRHGAIGDGGYIKAVNVGGNALCSPLTSANLDKVLICTNNVTQACW